MPTRAAILLVTLFGLFAHTGCGWSYASKNGVVAPDLEAPPESSPAVIVLEEAPSPAIK